ncbi:MAG: hypothetical protein F6K36_22080 [Symploca sp. SIO3C6]|nr:hypothetical protein [Symploca sp. SIO3C6]
MNYSLVEILELSEGFIDPNLINEQSFAHIKTIAKYFSRRLCRNFLFECRLNDSCSSVDFSIHLTPKALGNSPDIFNCFLSESVIADPVWQQIINFYQNWHARFQNLGLGIKSLGLEFDEDQYLAIPPIPSIFFNLRKFPDETPTNPLPGTSKSQQKNIFVHALTQLLGQPLLPKVEKNLWTCIDRLPSGARIFLVATMLSRNLNVIRFCLTGIQYQDIHSYLHGIGWTGSLTKVDELVSTVFEYTNTVVLHIDVGQKILPKLGFECYFPKEYKNSSLLDFVSFLVKHNLCSPAKRDSLLSWQGRFHGHLYESLLPYIFIKELSHIKLVYQSNSHLEAKGYLSLIYRDLNDNLAVEKSII